MRNENQSVYIVIVVFALLVLAGFYLIFDKIGGLSTDIKNVSLEVGLLKNQAAATLTTPTTQTPPPTNTNAQQNSSNSSQTNQSSGITIPTAIIVTTQSSPTLQPQTDITLTVENVVKQTDGTVNVTVKAFTSNATGYSSFEPSDFFQLIDSNGNNQKATQVTGTFNSIPPKSAIEGTVTFKIPQTQNSIILQIDSGDNTKFYEFDFDKQTYKETVIG